MNYAKHYCEPQKRKKNNVDGIMVLRNGSSSAEKEDKSRGHTKVTHGKMRSPLLERMMTSSNTINVAYTGPLRR